MAESLLLDHVTKRFANGALALDEVSLTVEPGTFLVLLGPSGSGKTTLVRSVAGIEHITSGRIAVGGRLLADARSHLPPDRRGLSMVFQDYALWPHLSALDNVAFALRRHRIRAAERRERAGRMLERVGLGQLASRYPSELSGGEQQRVALARALVGETGLVLCDEPLSNLDADLRERMRVEISALVRESGSTAVYITHDQAEAFARADRVGGLSDGRIVQLGTPERVYTHPATPFVARFTGLAAELRVRAGHAAAGEQIEVELSAGAGIRPIGARAVAPLEPGEALLAIRPSSAALCHPDSPGCQVRGEVADVAFRGRGYELVVDLPGGAKVAGVVTTERARRGERVGISFSSGGCLVFADTAASTTPRV